MYLICAACRAVMHRWNRTEVLSRMTPMRTWTFRSCHGEVRGRESHLSGFRLGSKYFGWFKGLETLGACRFVLLVPAARPRSFVLICLTDVLVGCGSPSLCCSACVYTRGEQAGSRCAFYCYLTHL